MKTFRAFLATLVLLGHSGAHGDDIDMLVQDRSPRGAAYLHVVLDSSSTAFRTLCTYGMGGSCAPPFMSPEVYSKLRSGHSPGDPVSRFEVFAALLSSLFKQPEFESLQIALLMSDRDRGARVLSTYRQLGGDYGGVSGAEELILAMAEISLEDSAAQRHKFQAKDAFYIWYRYINGASLEAAELDTCPVFYSVVMATESTIEDHTLDPGFARSLALTTLPDPGFTDVLTAMRRQSYDLLPGMPGGNTHLEQAWFVSPGGRGALVRQWAGAGGGGAPLSIDDPALLQQSLGIAFSRAVTGSHMSIAPWAAIASVGTAAPEHDIFLGLVEPGPTIRWPGNLKKYKLGSATTSGEGDVAGILDKKAVPATVTAGENQGRIDIGALSFWTEARFLPPGPSEDATSGVDGRAVKRGGAGQKVPGFISDGVDTIGRSNSEENSRQVFVEPESIVNGSTNYLLPLDTAGSAPAIVLGTRLAAASTAEAEQLILWARGVDVDDEDGDGDTTDVRPWLMGSVLHSKAVAFNYGAVAGYTAENPNIRVFLGTGDGVFHSFENTAVSGLDSGREAFAFYPAEGVANIKLWRDNSIPSHKMRYGVDGGISVLSVDNNNDGNLNYRAPDFDEAYVFFGMRRGGYSYYALDVSNPSSEPLLKWKISRFGGSDFAELGLTFSKPIVGKVQYGEKPLDVLIFAGGYNGGWDDGYEYKLGKDYSRAADVNPTTGSSTGNAIFIVNARTGELVWKAVFGSVTDSASSSTNTRFRHAEMVDSIPSTVSPLKTSAGIIHRLYVGDTGGALWRVDLPLASDAGDPDHRKQHWFVSKLAELGGEDEPSDRRFFHGPDIVRTRDSNGAAVDGVLISSGDRAHPNRTSTINYHFYIKDFIVSSGDEAVRDRPTIIISDAADSAIPDRTSCSGDLAADIDTVCSLSTENGWMIKLARPGEKSLSSPLVDGGKVFFTSYVPPEPSACRVSMGRAFTYIVKLRDGAAVQTGQRIFPLGQGNASAVLTLGEKLLLPLGGVDSIEDGPCAGVLCQSNSGKLYHLYRREPGVDEF